MAATILRSDISEEIKTIFQRQLDHAPVVSRSSLQDRQQKLKRLLAYVSDSQNQSRLVKALHQDFRKPEVETLSSEIGIVLQHLRYVRKHLRKWMRPQAVGTALAIVGTQSYIHYEAKGVCLIMSPWNYPFNLAIVPLIYAIAAGNTAIVKPSEIAPHTAAYIKDMIQELFDPTEVTVVEGEVQTATALLEQPFHHIFFTGSPQVGKIVMKAASQHLSSVTLELGGKSPAIVDETAHLPSISKRTTWGKFFNAGQTCIAPDYMIVHQSKVTAFIQEMQKHIDHFYKADANTIAESSSYARIISDKHFSRIQDLVADAIAKGATVAIGGTSRAAERYIEPTVLTGVTEDMLIMQEEIFGPVLPVLTYQKQEEIPAIIHRRPKPLSLYINSTDQSFIRYIIEHTSAGGTIINDYLLGYSNPELPFGGVNNSGIGKSMGLHGFREFSNERGIIHRRFLDISFIYPPYTKQVKKIVKLLARWI